MPRDAGQHASRSVRIEPAGSLDDFPTPPWATRALCEHVIDISGCSVWEPACGRGIMAAVLTEYAPVVFASDIHDYGVDINVSDFLNPRGMQCPADWVITNPPFNLALDFALKALDDASEGVALLVRTNWLEGVKRHDQLFSKRPPSLVAQFCERVPMVKGRWDPDATTATSYAWVVWEKRREHLKMPTQLMWIPGGQRKGLTKPDDRERFATPAAKKEAA